MVVSVVVIYFFLGVSVVCYVCVVILLVLGWLRVVLYFLFCWVC